MVIAVEAPGIDSIPVKATNKGEKVCTQNTLHVLPPPTSTHKSLKNRINTNQRQ